MFAIYYKGTNNTRFYQCWNICLIWKMRIKGHEEISESQPAASLLNKDVTVFHEENRPNKNV